MSKQPNPFLLDDIMLQNFRERRFQAREMKQKMKIEQEKVAFRLQTSLACGKHGHQLREKVPINQIL